MSETAKHMVASLYLAYFDRPAESAGLAYWTEKLDAGASFFDIARGFAGTAEARALYPDLAGDTMGNIQGFVHKVFGNIFDREAGPADIGYWYGEIAGGKPAWQVLIEMVLSAQGSDATKLANTLEVSLYATDAIGRAGISFITGDVRELINGVGFSQERIAEATKAVDDYIDGILNPPVTPEPEPEPEPNTPATIGGDLSAFVPIHVNVVDGEIVYGGALTISDPDAGEAFFSTIVTPLSAAGTLTIDADGGWSYSVSENDPAVIALGSGQSFADTFEITSLDGTSETITITIAATALLVVDFDDLPVDGEASVPADYNGFEWSTINSMGADYAETWPGSGFVNAIDSGAAIYTGGGGVTGAVEREDGSAFSLVSLSAGAAWKNGLNLYLHGFDASGSEVAAFHTTVDTDGLIDIILPDDFLGIYRLEISAAGGIDSGIPGGTHPENTHVILDDMSFYI